MIDGREAIEKSKTMKRTIFYLFCIWGLTVSSAVAQKRTASGLRLPRRRHGHLRV